MSTAAPPEERRRHAEELTRGKKEFGRRLSESVRDQRSGRQKELIAWAGIIAAVAFLFALGGGAFRGEFLGIQFQGFSLSVPSE